MERQFQSSEGSLTEAVGLTLALLRLLESALYEKVEEYCGVRGYGPLHDLFAIIESGQSECRSLIERGVACWGDDGE